MALNINRIIIALGLLAGLLFAAGETGGGLTICLAAMAASLCQRIQAIQRD